MSQIGRTSFPTFSRPVPASLAWFVFSILVAALIWQKYKINECEYRAFRRDKMERGYQYSACDLMKQGVPRSVIVVAGLLAQKHPPDFVLSKVNETIPGVRGMDEPAAAEWIAAHFNELQYDEKSQTWKSTPGATSQP